MQHRHRVFQSAGAVFHHRRHLRTLFHQLGIFLGDQVKLIHCTGQAGKTIGLFGSYGWGDGQWMRDWSDRMKQAGAYVLGGEDAICCGAPDASAEEALKELGRQLAES